MDRFDNTLSASICPADPERHPDRLTLTVPPQFWTESIAPPPDADEDQSSIAIYIDQHGIVKATFTKEASNWDHSGGLVPREVPTKELNNQEIAIVKATVTGFTERWTAENSPTE